MRMALDGNVEGDFETLNDDFVVEASKQIQQDTEDGEVKKVFDFKAYYASIMKEHAGSDDDDEEFDDDDDDVEMHETKRLENRLLDDHFDAVIKRYDDEDIGELDEEDPRVQDGLNSMENNEVLEDALADFEEFNKTLIDEDRTEEIKEKKKKKNDDVSNAIASAMSKVSGKSLMGIDADESSSDEEEEDEEETEECEGEEVDDDDIRTHSWYQRKEKAQWDCETILSTYSNLDNRPTTIAMKEARQGMYRIRLSKKTGLPLAPKRNKKKEKTETHDAAIAQALESIQSGAVLTQDEEFESLVVNDQDIYKRDKSETKAEKRERKRRVKAERRARRAQKKEMKNAFKKAESLVKRHEVSDKTSGRTVRRYE